MCLKNAKKHEILHVFSHVQKNEHIKITRCMMTNPLKHLTLRIRVLHILHYFALYMLFLMLITDICYLRDSSVFIKDYILQCIIDYIRIDIIQM